MTFTSNISRGNILTGEIISDGDQYVHSGGIANLMSVRSSGNQYIYYGGITNSTMIYSGGAQFVAGAANMTTINSSGVQKVGDSGTAASTIINSGGTQLVFSNGTAFTTTIYNGGIQEVFDNAVVSGTTIKSGGTQFVSTGGAANITTISSGGRQEIGGSGNAATAIINAGGVQHISAGGNATITTINSGGTQFVDGKATTTTISSGGAQYINSGGITSLSVVKNSGMLMIGSGGSAIGFNVSSGGIFGWDFNTVFSGKINGVAVASSSGNSSFNLFLNGGAQYVSSGETADSTNINSGGIQHLRRGGVANSTIVNSSGTQHVSSGGTAENTVINQGGLQEIYYFGTANDSVINNGGIQHVSSGGNVNNATINNGGDLFVDDYGQITGVLTVAGGHVTMENANAISGLTDMHYVISRANVSDTLVTVDGGLGSGIATYSLDLNNSAQGTYYLVESADLSNMNGKNFVIDYNDQSISLQVGSTYTFANGNSIKLSIFDATIDRLLANVSGDFIAPGTPVTLTTHAVGAIANLDWADSADNMSGIQNYSIEYATNNLFSEATTATSPTSNINLDFTGIAGVTTYYWHVKAQDNAGNWSSWSNESSFVVTPADIGANSYKTAKDISILDNWVGLGDPADCYKLTMTSAGTLTLNMTGLSGDANLSLLDINGKVLKISANKGNLSEAITNYALLAGTYYVNVAPSDGGKGTVNTNYTLTHAENYFPADTASNTWQTAKDIATLDNWVGFGDPADFYKLTMTRAGSLTLNLTGLAGDANLSLLDANGKVLKTSANKATANEAIVNYLLLGGTYYVNVAPADGGKGTANTNYTLTHAENYFPADTASNTWQAAKDIATLDNWVGFGDPADCYKITMTSAGTMTLNMTGLSGDANLSLLDANGKVLKTSANKGNTSESIANVLLAGGTYYINVAPVKGVNSANYTLTHAETYFPADTASNTWQTAKDIATLDNWVGFGDPADFYKLTMTRAGSLTLNLTGLSGDANLSLLDANGKVLKTSANRGNTAEAITAVLAGGTYYVNVAPVKGVNSANYTLTHAENYFPADTASNTWQAAKDIATLDNWVGFGDPADCYKITMTSAGTMTLNMTGLSGDANLSLLDANGKVLKTSANRGNTAEAITAVLAGGTYYINVAPVKGVNSANYTLTHAENYFPADTANNTWQTAKDIATLDNWVGFGDSADCYKITINNNGIMTLNLTGLTGDANLSLLDANGKVLKTSANRGNAAEAITADLSAGTYYINVAPVKGVNSANYTLTHTEKYCMGDTAGNSFDTALMLPANGITHEWMGFGDREDYYKFVVPVNNTTGTIGLSGFTSNINLFIYDSKRKQVAASTKSGLTNELATGKMDAGTYYCKVLLAGTGATEYDLNFNLTAPSVSAVRSGSLQIFSASSPLTGSSDTALTSNNNDQLKKNQGMLAD